MTRQLSSADNLRNVLPGLDVDHSNTISYSQGGNSYARTVNPRYIFPPVHFENIDQLYIIQWQGERRMLPSNFLTPVCPHCLTAVAEGQSEAADDAVDEEIMLYCRICDQRFSNQHNRDEHLAGRGHLNKLCFELNKETTGSAENTSCQRACPEHCGNAGSSSSSGIDQSIDITNTMETVVQKHLLREEEIQALRENFNSLKNANAKFREDKESLQVSTPFLPANYISLGVVLSH